MGEEEEQVSSSFFVLNASSLFFADMPVKLSLPGLGKILTNRSSEEENFTCSLRNYKQAPNLLFEVGLLPFPEKAYKGRKYDSEDFGQAHRRSTGRFGACFSF
jgi:hypothetical protein